MFRSYFGIASLFPAALATKLTNSYMPRQSRVWPSRLPLLSFQYTVVFMCFDQNYKASTWTKPRNLKTDTYSEEHGVLQDH